MNGAASVTARARPTEQAWVTEISASGCESRPDQVVGEEPLEVRVDWTGQDPETVAVTMRAPGQDVELAVGYSLAAGLARRPHDMRVTPSRRARWGRATLELLGR